MKVHAFAIRFRSTTPATVPARHKEYYRKVATLLFGDSNVGTGSIELDCDSTVPIASEHALSFVDLAKLLIAQIETSTCPNVLIDLGGPDEKDVATYHALMGLVVAVNGLTQKNADLRIGILLQMPLSDNDLTAPTIRNLVSDARRRLLFGNGAGWGVYFEKNTPPREKVSQWASDAQSNPLDGLTKKLIRRIGQYRVPSSGEIVRHFYDGHKACDEIYDIVVTELNQHVRKRDTLRLYYDARHSPWFRAPVQAALRDAGLSNGSQELLSSTDPKEVAACDVLLLPIVRTGQSLQSLLIASADSTKLPRVWALLSTRGNRERSGQRHVTLRNVQTPEVVVNYALRVEGERELPDANLWLRAPIATLDPSKEDLSAPFSADSMWGIILEAGLIPESPVPKRRSALGYVPNFNAIATLNATFIAAKVEALLAKQFKQSLPQSIAFLCPSEPNAETLANSLRDLARHDTIYASRDIIECCETNDLNKIRAVLPGSAIKDFDSLQDRLQAWKALTRNFADEDKPRVVLIDEFDVSGRTFAGLNNLALAFDLDVLCAISLSSFGPPRQHDALSCLTLYDLEYDLSDELSSLPEP